MESPTAVWSLSVGHGLWPPRQEGEILHSCRVVIKIRNVLTAKKLNSRHGSIWQKAVALLTAYSHGQLSLFHVIWSVPFKCLRSYQGLELGLCNRKRFLEGGRNLIPTGRVGSLYILRIECRKQRVPYSRYFLSSAPKRGFEFFTNIITHSLIFG